MALSKEEILEALKQVYDPEIPVDIVNLGLVVDVRIEPGTIYMKMTTTAPSCPVGNLIAAEAERVIRDLLEVERIVSAAAEPPEVVVEIVDDPPWSVEMMTAEGKRMMGRG